MIWLLLTACGGMQTYDAPIEVDDTFVRDPATGEALARYEAAAAYSEAHGGRAVLVLDGDRVVFETGQNGFALSDPQHLFSGTKSFSCAMFLAAEADGLLALDQGALLPAWTDDRAAITVGQLLSFTSGLDDAWWRLTWDGLRANQKVEDKYAVAVGLPLVATPGTTFTYGSQHLMAWGAVVEDATGEDPVDYLARRVTDPIGMQFSGWNRDPAGHPALPYGAWTTVNEWAKYGALARDDGAWGGEQILPPGGFDRCFVGSEPQPGYGLTWWLNALVTADQAALIPGDWSAGRLMPSAPDDLVMAAGANDQRLYVIRSLDLVVARLGDGDRAWSDDAFLAALLGDTR